MAVVRRFAPFAAAAAFAVLAVPAAADDLNIYNWSDYIGETTIADFEAKSGLDVTYDVFDSNEVLETKLLAGSTGYDVVVPSGSFLERQIQAGVFQKLDKSKLKNYGNLDPNILKSVAGHDPDNAYAIPYMWGTTGIGFTDKVFEIMPDAPVDSWDIIFQPELAAKFKDCGISMLDAPSEIFEIALNYLGLDPHSQSKTDLDKAERLIATTRDNIKYFHSSQYINDLANGDICIAVGWSGDILQARDRAAEAAEAGTGKVAVDYRIPNEGTVVWFDLMAIPVDAKNVDAAHAWLDFILEPKVVADATNYVAYANANRAANEFVDPDILSDAAVYPDDAVKARLFADKAVGARYDRLRTRAWTRVKTGN